MNLPDFETMTLDQAVEYCYRHADEFKSECYASGEDGDRQFDCLVAIVEGGTIHPREMGDYGMEYME